MINKVWFEIKLPWMHVTVVKGEEEDSEYQFEVYSKKGRAKRVLEIAHQDSLNDAILCAIELVHNSVEETYCNAKSEDEFEDLFKE